MNTGTVNILDQLLGLTDLPTGLQTPGGGGVSGQPGLFGDLLGLVMNATEGGTPTVQPFSLLSLVNPETEQTTDSDVAPALLSQVAVEGSVKTFLPLGLKNESLEETSQIALQSGEVVDREVDAFAEEALKHVKPNTLTIRERIPVQEGTYAVQDAKVSEQSLELTLKSDDSAEPIKITVPVRDQVDASVVKSDLLALKSSHQPTTAKTDINGQTVRALNELTSDLLAKLKVTTVEVSAVTDATDSVEIVEQQQTIKIIADTAKGEQVFKTVLPTTQVVATREIKHTEKTVRANAEEALVSEVDEPKAKSPRLTSLQTGDTSETASDVKTVTRREEPFLWQERANQKLDHASQVTQSNTAASTEKSQAMSVDMRAMEQPQVKVSVPDLRGHSFSNNGQSVTLRLEPDHLGPAKLQLSIRQDVITAKVVVESAHAKIALENSLPHLSEQLNRAGVLVDRVEVVLAGGENQQQFNGRNAQWHHTRKMRQRWLEDDVEDVDGTTSTTMASQIRPQIVTDRSVNLVA